MRRPKRGGRRGWRTACFHGRDSTVRDLREHTRTATGAPTTISASMSAPTKVDAVSRQGLSPAHDYEAIRAYFDRFSGVEARWKRRNRTYHKLVASLYRFLVSPNARVLEIGCGQGDLLAALSPSRGVGIDVSQEMVALARSRHPACTFEVLAGEALNRDEVFDYIIFQ